MFKVVINHFRTYRHHEKYKLQSTTHYTSPKLNQISEAYKMRASLLKAYNCLFQHKFRLKYYALQIQQLANIFIKVMYLAFYNAGKVPY